MKPAMRVTICVFFASPLEGEAGAERAGRGVSDKLRANCLPPSLALPLKGGGDRHSSGQGHPL